MTRKCIITILLYQVIKIYVEGNNISLIRVSLIHKIIKISSLNIRRIKDKMINDKAFKFLSKPERYNEIQT